MSAAFFPKNPNNVSKSRGNARSSLGICPLTQAKVQLIPLGIRLLRDGWLYVIEGSTGILSEYRVLDGLVNAMFGQGEKVAVDQRTQPINTPSLIYDKRSTLHVSYAEAQWTAKMQPSVERHQRARSLYAGREPEPHFLSKSWLASADS